MGISRGNVVAFRAPCAFPSNYIAEDVPKAG